jgi:hypothetical protein
LSLHGQGGELGIRGTRSATALNPHATPKQFMVPVITEYRTICGSLGGNTASSVTTTPECHYVVEPQIPLREFSIPFGDRCITKSPRAPQELRRRSGRGSAAPVFP